MYLLRSMNNATNLLVHVIPKIQLNEEQGRKKGRLKPLERKSTRESKITLKAGD